MTNNLICVHLAYHELKHGGLLEEHSPPENFFSLSTFIFPFVHSPCLYLSTNLKVCFYFLY